MTQAIQIFGFEFAPTLIQRQFAGRFLCVVAAAPLTVLLLAPLLLQAARIW